jgi:hypothetical protein
MTRQIKYSLLIFIAGFILFAIIHALTTHDDSFVIVDKEYLKRLDRDITIKYYGGFILIVSCLAGTALSGYSLTKKSSKIIFLLFGLQLVTSLLIIYVLFLASTSFFF